MAMYVRGVSENGPLRRTPEAGRDSSARRELRKEERSRRTTESSGRKRRRGRSSRSHTWGVDYCKLHLSMFEGGVMGGLSRTNGCLKLASSGIGSGSSSARPRSGV